MSYGEAISLVFSLRDQPGTQMYARARGWSYAMTITEIAQVMQAQAFINGFVLPKGQKAVVFPMPWDDIEDEPVSDDDRARLKGELAERSAFGP